MGDIIFDTLEAILSATRQGALVANEAPRESNWEKYASEDEKNNWIRTKRAVLALGIVGAGIAGPALYAYSLNSKKKRKKAITEKEAIFGASLEQVSNNTTSLSMTALAAPAIALPIIYWLIEIGENFPRATYDSTGKRIKPRGTYSGRFGDSMQTLEAAAVAAPVISALAGMASSAFKKAPVGTTVNVGKAKA